MMTVPDEVVWNQSDLAGRRWQWLDHVPESFAVEIIEVVVWQQHVGSAPEQQHSETEADHAQWSLTGRAGRFAVIFFILTMTRYRYGIDCKEPL